MKKCQKNTINSFVKYLTSPDVQKVLKLNQQSKEKKVTKGKIFLPFVFSVFDQVA